MPTNFVSWIEDYLLNPSYYADNLILYSKRVFLPIIAFKLGRRQFGWKGGFLCLIGGMAFANNIAPKMCNFILDLIDWHWTQLKNLISHFT